MFFCKKLTAVGRIVFWASPMTGWFDAGLIRIRLPGWAYALARLLFCDRTDGEPVVAVEVVPEDIDGIEVDTPRRIIVQYEA